ncbi:MAG: RNA polymerase factor sigma-54 [Muribaculaceae bacterium]
MARKTSIDMSQTMEQTQRQVTLPSTILAGKILEKSHEEVLQYVNDELDKNPALEPVSDDGNLPDAHSRDSYDDDDDGYGDGGYDGGERNNNRDDYTGNMFGSDDDDDTPYYLRRQGNQRNIDDERYVPDVVEEESLYEHLLEQLQQLDLTPDQMMIGRYVIGNIDSNGYLTRKAYDISYDILTKESREIDEDEVQRVIDIIKTLDPVGICAMNLRECLMIQLKPRIATDKCAELAYRAVDRYLDDIANRHFELLRRALRVSDEQLAEVISTIQHLNPQPGARFVNDRTVQHGVAVNPDFMVEYDDELGEMIITSLNRMPQLQVSESYRVLSQTKQSGRRSGNASDRNSQKLARNYVTDAEDLIELLKIRQSTLLRVVKAIVDKQKEYFMTLDEGNLHPLTLADIAPIVGNDVSVISRATKGKYLQTRNGCLPFKFFFTEGMVMKGGDGDDDSREASTHEILKELKRLIDNEDKQRPLTDQALTDALNKMGYPIRRRTVAKYREERLNIPVARQRKEHMVRSK